MKYANISWEVSPTENWCEFFWQGDDRLPVMIDLHHFSQFPNCTVNINADVGDIVTLGHLRLRIVERLYDFPYWMVTAMRDGWRARVYAIIYQTKHILSKINYRLLLTMSIWGLATSPYVKMGQKLTWGDVHIVRWVITKLRGAKAK